MSAGSDLRVAIAAAAIETFRKALMVEHANDWDMDTVSEAAHICAKALADDPVWRQAWERSQAIDAAIEEGDDLVTIIALPNGHKAVSAYGLLASLRAIAVPGPATPVDTVCGPVGVSERAETGNREETA